MREVEDVVEQERRALSRGETLQHYEERPRDAVDRLHAPEAALAEIDRLRKAITSALFAAGPRAIQLVEAEVGDGLDEERLGRVDPFGAARPAQPGFLHDILGAADVAEHSVGERDQFGTVGFERLGVGAHVCSAASASGASAAGAPRRRRSSRTSAAVENSANTISGLSANAENGP